MKKSSLRHCRAFDMGPRRFINTRVLAIFRWSIIKPARDSQSKSSRLEDWLVVKLRAARNLRDSLSVPRERPRGSIKRFSSTARPGPRTRNDPFIRSLRLRLIELRREECRCRRRFDRALEVMKSYCREIGSPISLPIVPRREVKFMTSFALER